jgi:RNA polymerase sigma-70 factor (ECF subfamily)
MLMRVTRIPTGDGTDALRVEGRLTHHTADELRTACEAVPGGTAARRVDVSGLQYADATGAALLRDLERRGVELTGRTGFLDELLREPTGPSADAQLVARLREGDAAAHEQIVREHGGRMLAAARRLLRVEEDARDVVQESFIAAFRAIDGFAGTARLSTWLHRIVVNTALMRLRSRRRRHEDSIEDLLPKFAEDGHFADEQQEWETSCEDVLDRQQTRAMVRAAIDQLPENYRTVLVLRDLEELDTDETAAALGVTPNTVKTRLHRARHALRALLASALGHAMPKDAARARA